MNKFVLPGVAVLGVTAGLAGANIAANAESVTSGTNSQTTSQQVAQQAGPQNTTAGGQNGGKHQMNGKTETELTGTDLSKATTAATAKVSGGTVVRAETDADGDGTYEVHMKDSSGNMVTVFLDANFNVTSQTNGMSAKNPAPQQNNQQPGTSTNTQNNN